jgi:catechol 2,3-dioxygenase-like lactoylglutathione lyase family enzyme
MITGMHAIVFSSDAESVRRFFADTLGLASVDAGEGWPMFALPPAEMAVHPLDRVNPVDPVETGGRHELFLMCDDIRATLTELQAKGVEVAQEPADQRWGAVAAIRLPDGTELGVYEPRHPSPLRTSEPG